MLKLITKVYGFGQDTVAQAYFLHLSKKKKGVNLYDLIPCCRLINFVKSEIPSYLSVLKYPSLSVLNRFLFLTFLEAEKFRIRAFWTFVGYLAQMIKNQFAM